MNPADIITAIKAHMDSPAIPGLIMVWPNLEGSPARPYAMVEVDMIGTTDNTLDATNARTSGVIRIVIVTDEGIGDRQANTFAWHFTQRFVVPTHHDFVGGLIECNKPPSVKRGYAQGAAWRVPLEIPFIAHA